MARRINIFGMSVLLGILALFILGFAIHARAQDEVAPESVSHSIYRDGTPGQVTGRFYESGPLLLTNWQAFADASGAVTQGLELVAIEVRVGDQNTNIAYVGYPINVSNGTFWCLIDVPAISNVSGCLIQVQLTDTNGGSARYPQDSLLRSAALQ